MVGVASDGLEELQIHVHFAETFMATLSRRNPRRSLHGQPSRNGQRHRDPVLDCAGVHQREAVLPQQRAKEQGRLQHRHLLAQAGPGTSLWHRQESREAGNRVGTTSSGDGNSSSSSGGGTGSSCGQRREEEPKKTPLKHSR